MSQGPKAIVDQRKLDKEGYVHEITFDPRFTSQQLDRFAELNKIAFGIMQRVCDGCRGNITIKEFVECACENKACQQHYDLCSGCKGTHITTKCPPGYGCGNIN